MENKRVVIDMSIEEKSRLDKYAKRRDHSFWKL